MAERGRWTRSRGASAVEFVLLAPILILVMAGAITLSLAAAAKFRMSDAAMVAARRCVIGNPQQCAATAPGDVAARWPDGARVCGQSGVRTAVTLVNSVATVELRCGFTGGVFQGVLGLGAINLVTSSAMPF